MKYCISCGYKGAIWPKDTPMCCTMHCAANRLLGEYSASSDGFYCPDCGEPADNHDCGASEQKEGVKRESWLERYYRLLRRK